MGVLGLSAAVLTCCALVGAQYGPLKGSGTRRTTTPFPPGFQSDNQLYNSPSNSITPDSNQISHNYAYSDNTGSHSGSFSASSSGCGGGGCGAPSGTGSGYGVLSGSNQKTPAGAASFSDNPWLSGVVAQNSGPGPSYQQTVPTVPCNQPGHVCVPKHSCQGGQTTSPGTGKRQCDSNTEICCRQQGPASRPSPQAGYGSGPQPTHQPAQRPSPHPGQSFQQGQSPQSGYQPGPSYQPGHQTAPSYQPTQPGPTHQGGQPSGPSYQPGQPSGPSYQPGQPSRPSYQPGQPSGPSYQPGQPSGPSHQPGQPSGPSYQPGQPSRPSYQPGQPSGPSYQPGQQPGPSFQPGPSYQGQGQRPQPGQQGHYQPQGGHQQSQPAFRPGTNGVPVGGSIYDNRPGSSYVTPAYGPYTGPLNTTPHPGCPAALKCVEEIYCDAKGVMQDSPVQLTREEYENRVPLSECQNIETGIIGKCCRDPNYKDPWPDMNNGFDDGHYHGDHGAHGGHGDHGHPGQPGGAHGQFSQPQGQFHQQGTSSDTCGPSATCTLQSQCSGDRQVQPGKHCRNPHDGSTGVCCSKPPFPSYTNNHQVATVSPTTTTTHRPLPGHQYYTPKPSYSNNPFLNQNQGRFPSPQQPSSQGPIHPTGISPVNYQPTQPNAIPGPQKEYNQNKPTPAPFRPGYNNPQAPSTSVPQQSQAHSPQPSSGPSYQRPSSSPNYQQPSSSPSYQRPSSGPSYQQPSSSPSYQQPSSSPNYQQPSSSPSYQRPSSSPSYQQPSSTPSYQQPSSSPNYQRPSSSPTYQQPSSPQQPQPHYPQTPSSPNYQQPESTRFSSTTQPSYQRPSLQTTATAQPVQPSNLPAFPQIATANSVYTPRPGQFSTPTPTSPNQQSPTTQTDSVSHLGAVLSLDQNKPQPSFTPTPIETNDITPAQNASPFPSVSPTRGRGPPGGYPFLAPTTESNKKSPVNDVGKCGVRRNTQRPNGPNGLETGFGEFPWHVQVLSSESQTPLCSGAILSARVIVTAAHCVDDFKSSEVSVKAGDWKLGTDAADEPKPAQIRKVSAISRHPKYDPVSRFYDMAALILSEPLEIDEHVDVLCLGDNTPPGQKPGGTQCVVTGWGKNNLQSNTQGSVMHSIPVSFIESDQCEDTFRKTNLGKYFQLNKSFVCAVPDSPNDDLCQVDVGSPIACQKPNGRYELAGVYSWDVGCHQPVASSKVDKPWVESVMKKPIEQLKQEEQAELQKKENLGFNPQNSDSNKPGFSQGYGKK